MAKEVVYAVPTNLIKPKRLSNSKNKRIVDWNTLFRRNMHIFAELYLEVKLHPFQRMEIYEMGVRNTTTIAAARATAKSWLCALAAICFAILYPGSEIVIVSSVKKQAGIILEKIQDFMNKYPNIAREIIKITINQNSMEAPFYNTSKIFVVTCSDSARGKNINLKYQ